MASYVSGVCSQCVRPFVSVGIESACSVTLKEGGPFVTPVVTTDRYFLGAASARKRSVRHAIGSDLTAVHRFVGLLTSLNSHLATHLIPTASCTFKLAAHQCSPHRYVHTLWHHPIRPNHGRSDHAHTSLTLGLHRPLARAF